MIEISGFSFGFLELGLLIGFVLAFLIQLFYQLLMSIFTLSGRKKEKQDGYPSISIIIPSRNYEENLRELIPTLIEQDYPDFEVVVVDDCSSDGTEWYLAGLKLISNRIKTSRIIQETDFPNALVITIGVRAATKDWLIFLNPLCRVGSKDWLRSFAKGINQKTEAVFGFTRYVNHDGSMQKLIRYENLDSFLLSGSARYFGLPMPITDMNMAYKREQFLELKGFAGVLDARFSENELYINKISRRKNTTFLLGRSTIVDFKGDTDWHDGMNFKKKHLLLKRKFTFGQNVFLWINSLSRLAFDILMVLLLIISPWRLYVAGVYLFKIIHELIWGLVAAKRLGEKKLLPSLIIYRSLVPILSFILSVKQLFTRKKRRR